MSSLGGADSREKERRRTRTVEMICLPKENSEKRMGGRTQRNAQAWEQLGYCPWIREGVEVHFVDDWTGQDWDWKKVREMKLIEKENQRAGLLEVLREELFQGVVEETTIAQVRWISPVFLIRKKSGKMRRILDCRSVNAHIHTEHFKMVNVQMVAAIIHPSDWAISLDLTAAYGSLATSNNLRQYTGFVLDGKVFAQVGLPFGVNIAPLIFTKTMEVVFRWIRQVYSIRCLFYIDDLLFLHHDPKLLIDSVSHIVTLLVRLGFVINREKSLLSPSRIFTYLGWEWDTARFIVRLPEERRNRLSALTSNWEGAMKEERTVTIREFASLIGQLVATSFVYTQASMRLKVLDMMKVKAVARDQWTGTMSLTEDLAEELQWWKRNLAGWRERELGYLQIQGIINTDASPVGMGAVFLNLEEGTISMKEIEERKKEDTQARSLNREWKQSITKHPIGDWFSPSVDPTHLGHAIRAVRNAWLRSVGEGAEQGRQPQFMASSWREEMKTKSSNRKELEAVGLALTHFAEEIQQLKRRRVLILSDNMATVCCINRWRSCMNLRNNLLHVGNVVERLDVQIVALHVRGMYNQTADALSRISHSGDYAIESSILLSALGQLRVRPTVDLFASEQNHQLPTYCAPNNISGGAIAEDAFAIPWRGHLPLIHPPISMIQRCLSRIRLESLTAVIIAPIWKGAIWMTDLEEMTQRSLLLGNSEEVLIKGRWMIKSNLALPPGCIGMYLVSHQTRESHSQEPGSRREEERTDASTTCLDPSQNTH